MGISRIDYSKDLNELTHTEVQLHMIEDKHAMLEIRMKGLERRRDKLAMELSMTEKEIEKVDKEAMWCCQEMLRIRAIKEKELTNEE